MMHTRHSNLRRRCFRVVLACLCLGVVTETQAYIDLAPTLGKIVGDSQKISVVEVIDFNEATNILTLKEVRSPT
jgi:hypothetical protein